MNSFNLNSPKKTCFRISGRSLSCHDNIPRHGFSCTDLYITGLEKFEVLSNRNEKQHCY